MIEYFGEEQKKQLYEDLMFKIETKGVLSSIEILMLIDLAEELNKLNKSKELKKLIKEYNKNKIIY